MNDIFRFLSSVDVLAAITGVLAVAFSIFTAVLSLKKEKGKKINSGQKKESLVIRVNGKKLEVFGDDKEALQNILNLKGGEYIFIERIEHVEGKNKGD